MTNPHQGETREHPEGTKVLILGILSLVICGLLGPFAWSMGNRVLKEIDGSSAAYSNRGSVKAGRICGMIASILLILYVIAIVIIVIIAVASPDSGALAALG